MATPQKVANRADAVIEALKKNDRLTLSERDDMIEIMSEAREGTNGLTVEEKTQANSVNLANLTYLFIRHLLEGCETGRAGLYGLIRDCRWQIVILGGFLTLLLAFRPQLAAIIEKLL